VGAGLGLIAAVALAAILTGHRGVRRSDSCGRAYVCPAASWCDPRIIEPDHMTAIRRGHDKAVGDRAYQVLPAWFAKAGVLMNLVDDQDPHSAWLIASRRPSALQAALLTRVAD
jgi:hypothetical protein